MTYEHVLTELKDGIFTITFNRPEVLNAFNWRQQWEFNCALHDGLENSDARVVVLTGSGKGFSAGLDLKSGMVGWGKPLSDRKLTDIPTLMVKHYTKPLIAAINGPAVGWGCTLSLCCDMRFASESAYMSVRFVRVGLIPEGGSAKLLPQIVGLAKALELGLTGRNVPAKEAAAIGLVNDIFPDRELLPRVYDVAAMIADNSPLPVELARKNFYDALDQTWEQQQQQESVAFARAASSPDHAQRAKSFTTTKKYKT